MKGLIKVEATVYLFLQNGGKEQCFISWLVGVDTAMQTCILFCFLLVLYLAEIYTSIWLNNKSTITLNSCSWWILCIKLKCSVYSNLTRMFLSTIFQCNIALGWSSIPLKNNHYSLLMTDGYSSLNFMFECWNKHYVE